MLNERNIKLRHVLLLGLAIVSGGAVMLSLSSATSNGVALKRRQVWLFAAPPHENRAILMTKLEDDRELAFTRRTVRHAMVWL